MNDVEAIEGSTQVTKHKRQADAMCREAPHVQTGVKSLISRDEKGDHRIIKSMTQSGVSWVPLVASGNQ